MEQMGLHLVEVNTVVVVRHGETPQIHQQVQDGPEDHRGVGPVVGNVNTQSVDILGLDLFNLNAKIISLLDVFFNLKS